MEPKHRTPRRAAPRKKVPAVLRALGMAARTRQRMKWKPPRKG